MNEFAGDQADFAAASGCTASPRYPAVAHQTCTDLQNDENHVQTISKLCFRPKSHDPFAKNSPSNLFLLAQFSISILKVSLDLDSTLATLLAFPKHTAVDSSLPRQFAVLKRGLVMQAQHARPLTLPVSAPREICASMPTLRPPCIAFPPASCRLPIPMIPSQPMSPSTPRPPRRLPRNAKIRHRFENHLISTSCYMNLSMFRRTLAAVRISASLASLPSHHLPLSPSLHLRNPCPGH